MEIDNTAIVAQFTPGSLVSARGREWVVLPPPAEFEDAPNFLYVKPLDGSDAETTAILTDLEPVKPAKFSPPNPERCGNNRSCRYLRDALRFGARDGAGPFPSFSRYAFDPRPYQYAPLMLALRQDTTRLLIADDVGVGKTIETGMIIRELLDRGECRRFCVLCPPYLAEQWRDELYSKFQIDTTLVLASTVAKLERQLAADESIYDAHPYIIASIDFIKTGARRNDFLKSAPELIVIDEAHAVAREVGSSASHQRYSLARDLCEYEGDDDPKKRHVVLVTATPHSGKEGAFRSLLGLLDKKFLDDKEFPADLRGAANEKKRKEIAKYFIQRRRAVVQDFLSEKTPFPACETADKEWLLSEPYKAFFNDALDFARELVNDNSGTKREHRLRWWSALSLMRSLASSPAAAEATLQNRAQTNPGEDAEPVEEDDDEAFSNFVEETGARAVLDADVYDGDEIVDAPLPVDPARREVAESRKKLRELAERAKALRGLPSDSKLAALIQTLKEQIKDGYSPIVFCRFIPTVDYLVEELRKALPSFVEIAGVTSELPREEREERVWSLADKKKRILVCTDCLSEGLNLQNLFNATIHYDLSWNPTRHEQREGRVDRFGQPSPKVRSITFYGKDNDIDGIVLDVILRKHVEIKKSLGVSVPIPVDSRSLMEKIFDGFLKRGRRNANQPLLPGMEEYFKEELRETKESLFADWDDAAHRVAETQREDEEDSAVATPSEGYVLKDQKRGRNTFFAHGATMKEIAPAVSRELDETQRILGSSGDVRWFVENAIQDSGGTVVEEDGVSILTLTGASAGLREYLPDYDQWRVSFNTAASGDAEHVSRAHPIVSAISEYALHTALDPFAENSLASRCGVIRTRDVAKMTTALLLRLRFKTTTRTRDGRDVQSLAEEIRVVAYDGVPDEPRFLNDDETAILFDVKPSYNVKPEESKIWIGKFLKESYPLIQPKLVEIARERAEALKEARERVRKALGASKTNRPVEVVPEAEPDLVGVYVYLPLQPN